MSSDVLQVCCHCHRVKDWHNEHNDNIVLTPELLEMAGTTQASHGICDDCLEEHYGVKKEREDD